MTHRASFATRQDAWHATLHTGNTRLFAAALVLAVAPIWFTGYVPMVDLPQHAAQISALHGLGRGDPVFVESFTTNWFTPYLLGYALLYALSTVLPIQMAAQLLVSSALIAIPVATSALLKEVGADANWRWLAIPCAYSFAFYWGFLSFLVAVPVALLVLTAAIRYDREASFRNGGVLAGLTVALFFCHVIALGFVGLVAAAYVWSRHRAQPLLAIARCLPLAAPLPLIVLWGLSTYQAEAVAQDAPVLFGPLMVRLRLLLIQPAGFDRMSWVATLVTSTIVLLPVLAGSKPSRDVSRWVPFAVGLLLFLVWPRSAFHTAYMFPRLGVFLVPLWLLGWDPPVERRSRLDAIAMTVVLVWLFANVGRFAAFAREVEPLDQLIMRMEPGQHVAGLVLERDSRLFASPIYMHMPAWYQAKRGGVVDFSFSDAYAPVVRSKSTRGPRISERVGWYPWEMDWARQRGDQYRYFIVKAAVDPRPVLFDRWTDSVTLLEREGDWWLFENASAKPAVAALTEAP